MNVCESDRLRLLLNEYNIIETSNDFDSDVFILNTCSVRDQSEQKAFSFLGKLQIIKKYNKNIIVVVIGCMANRLNIKIKSRFKFVDIILYNKGIDDIFFEILDLCKKNNYFLMKGKKKQNFEITKYITIMQGCNNYCSYCIVPFVRGNERSFDYKKIINEIYEYVNNGTKEIILLGQNVNSYMYNNVNFKLLIEQIVKIKDLKRIRFMTNHPKDLNDDLIHLIAKEKKICTNIHIPLQSGSNKILKLMNRMYTYEYYFELIKKIRNIIQNVRLTSDIIVGFPSETNEDFLKTFNAICEIEFDSLYVFKYSKRLNTKAAMMVDDIDIQEKKRRHSIILKKSREISIEKKRKMIGTRQKVLFEKIENNIMKSKTRSGCNVFFEFVDKKYIGKICDVYIQKISNNLLFGIICK
jgi:tRNA-2-methylthio-N6-dimethylallyladenosine synthase